MFICLNVVGRGDKQRFTVVTFDENWRTAEYRRGFRARRSINARTFLARQDQDDSELMVAAYIYKRVDVM